MTAPARSDSFDRFVARNREPAAAWVVWALTQRSFTSAQKLVELALASRLIIRATPFTHDQLGETLDLLRWVSLVVGDGKATRLNSAAALKSLRRRLEARPDDQVVLSVDARGLSESLPVLAPPRLEPTSIVRFPGLPTLHFGATLIDVGELPIDPDPPPEKETAIPPSALPLFDAIYAQPDDDGLREVLADALEEAGHPRGRLIRLQLARASSGLAPTPEETGLLERHEASWLGDLQRLLGAVRWERGFPVEGQLREHLPGLLRRPEMNTVDRLHLDPTGKTVPQAVLERLTVATHVGLAALPRFTHGHFPRLTSLHCQTPGLIEFGGVPAKELLALGEGRGLPKLTRLELDDGILERKEEAPTGAGS